MLTSLRMWQSRTIGVVLNVLQEGNRDDGKQGSKDSTKDSTVMVDISHGKFDLTASVLSFSVV